MNDYELIKVIGQGGMGCVYEGRSPSGQRVAIKMMSNKVTAYPEFRDFFTAEAHALEQMNHPSVVKIMGEPFSDVQGNMYLPMEFVEGETVEHHVSNYGHYREAEAVELMAKILDAMAYVHRKKCIHRDIKPSNIMLRPDGSICVIDFGVAKDARTHTGKTIGYVIGTDGYMSPEQAQGDSIDYRTDIYSLGCLLYYMVTGQHAVKKGANSYETVCAILKNPVVMPRALNPQLSDRLQQVIMKAMDKNMLRRYQTAEEFKNALLAGSTTVNGYADNNNGKTKVMPDDGLIELTIGRSPSCDIVVPSQYVSGKHATLRAWPQGTTPIDDWELEFVDHSTNGTSVNGRRLYHASCRFESESDYGFAFSLPEILLSGRPDCKLDWGEVKMALDRKRGGGTPPPPPPPPPGDDEPGGNTGPGVYQPPTVTDPSLSAGLAIVSFLFPIVGWILWAVWHKETPRRARTASFCGWGGFAVGIILRILMAL